MTKLKDDAVELLNKLIASDNEVDYVGVFKVDYLGQNPIALHNTKDKKGRSVPEDVIRKICISEVAKMQANPYSEFRFEINDKNLVIFYPLKFRNYVAVYYSSRKEDQESFNNAVQEHGKEEKEVVKKYLESL